MHSKSSDLTVLEKSGTVIETSLLSHATGRYYSLNNKLSLAILDTVRYILSFCRPLPASVVKINMSVWSDLWSGEYFLVFIVFCLSRDITLHLTDFFSLQFILVHLASNSAQGEDSVLEMAASKSCNSVLVFDFCHIIHLMIWKLKWFSFHSLLFEMTKCKTRLAPRMHKAHWRAKDQSF